MINFIHSHSATLWYQEFDIFYILMYYSKPVGGIDLKRSDISLNTLMMNHRENGDSSSKGVSVAAQRVLMFRHENSSASISTEQDHICTKLDMLNIRPSLNTTTLTNLEIHRAPPIGKWKFRHYIFTSHCLKHCEINLKIGLMRLQAITMPLCEDVDISYNAVAMATQSLF